MQVLVKHLMTSPVVTLFAEQTLPLAEDIMHLKHIRHLPVVDDEGRILGLVTHRDLMRAQISSLTGLLPEERRARQEGVRVHQLMTRDIWTVMADTPAAAAGRMLVDHRFGCLPVVDPREVVIGMLTERDFLKFAIRTIEEQD